MMQNFMTQSLWGRGGGEGRSSHQLSAPGSPAKEGQFPDRFRLSLAPWEAEVAEPTSLQSQA